METHLLYTFWVYPPASVTTNPNVTLHLDVKKVLLEDLSSGEDTLNLDGTRIMETHLTFNFSPPTLSSYDIQLSRESIQADVRKQKLDEMPGFRVTWHYSGIEVESWAKYYKNTKYPSTMAFVRHYSNNIPR